MSTTAIVLSWNRPRMLEEALDSIRAQTLAPARVVVVDDGSTAFNVTDLVRPILPDAYILAAPPMQPGMRAVLPRLGRLINVALGFTRQEDVVTYLCDDDLWHREWIEHVERAMADKAAHFCRGRWYAFNDGQVPGMEKRANLDQRGMTTGNFAHSAACVLNEGLRWPEDVVLSLDDVFLHELVKHHGEVRDIDRPAGWRRLHRFNMITYARAHHFSPAGLEMIAGDKQED